MFRQFKLGTKIFGSFSLVLALFISLACFNFYELTGIINRVTLADAINRLNGNIFNARQYEKNFIIRGEPTFSDNGLKEMRLFEKHAADIKSQYPQHDIHAKIDRMRTQADSYTKAFQEYINLAGIKNQTMEEMEKKAGTALEKTASIRDYQKKQLEEIRQNSQSLFVNKLMLVDEANQIYNTAIEGKAFRMAIVNQNDLSRMVEWEGNNKKLENLVNQLKSKLKEPANITLAENILVQKNKYIQAVLQYTENKNGDNLDNMIESVNQYMSAISSLQFDLKEQLEFLQEDTTILVDEKLAIAEDADHIANWFLDSRMKEKEFIISHDMKYFQMAGDLTQKVLAVAEACKTKLKSDEELKQVEDILHAVKTYQQAFEKYATLTKQQEGADQRMIQDALAVETACNLERENQNLLMKKQIDRSNLFMICGAGIAILFGTVFAFLITRAVARPIRNLAQEARRLSEGNIELSDDEKKYIEKITTRKDEVGDIGHAFSQLISYMKEKVSAAGQIADGNLDIEVQLLSREDQLGLALQKMLISLNNVISHLHNAADQVDAGSSQVSASSQSLASGATQQASSLEQISASMTEIGNQTRTNAENSSKADKLVTDTKTASEKGIRQMETMMTAIGSISDASKKIDKIIKVIDDIAFQTNLLALNAAVEAARAGKHGKGFAVVAQEVRNLAAKSGKAARETTELIQSTAQTVDDGNRIAQITADALSEINEGVTKVASLVKEIALASNEQAHGISQITQGLSQIDDVTQQNTANAEETSAEAQELSSQAAQVRKLLNRFTIKKTDPSQKKSPPLLT